jgi:hypothetical protein
MRKAITIVVDRDTPWWQCTKTVPPLSMASLTNSTHE